MIQLVLTAYSAFKSSSKMIQKQAAAAVREKQVKEKEKKKEGSVWNFGLLKEENPRILWNSACRTAVRRRI